MLKRELVQLTLATVEVEDASERLDVVRELWAADHEEHLRAQMVAINDALALLKDAAQRLHQQSPGGSGIPVADAAGYLGVSEPTVRLWLRKGLLRAMPGAKTTLIMPKDLRRVARAVAELRDRGQDRDWVRALVDLVHDRDAVRQDAVREGLDDLARGNLEPA